MVALITIKDNYLESTLSLRNSMLIKVLDLFQSSLIIYPAIQRGLNNPVRQKAAFSILEGKVVNALDNQEQRQRKPIAAYILNCSCPFPITRLKLLALATLVGTGNNYTAIDNAHYKACLVKVVEVAVLDAILYIYISYKLKPYVYKVRVFIEGPLEVVYMRYMRLKLKAALYEVVCLLGANRLHTMCCKEGICYIFYTTDLGQKSLHIQVKDILYKCIFFSWGQLVIAVISIGKERHALYLEADRAFRDVIRLCSTLD